MAWVGKDRHIKDLERGGREQPDSSSQTTVGRKAVSHIYSKSLTGHYWRKEGRRLDSFSCRPLQDHQQPCRHPPGPSDSYLTPAALLSAISFRGRKGEGQASDWGTLSSPLWLAPDMPENRSVTGGGRGRVPPRDFCHREISADLPGKRGKEKKEKRGEN